MSQYSSLRQIIRKLQVPDVNINAKMAVGLNTLELWDTVDHFDATALI
jgi:hypothetical protein